MKRELPPLNAIKAFEAAARNMSFSLAAQELCVTQGAISKQIQRLESTLNQPLFNRQGSAITLTMAGKRYLPAISDALDTIQLATAQLQQSVNKTDILTLEVTPSFSSLWLIPALVDFQQQYPEFHIDIRIDHYPASSATPDVDIDLQIQCLLPNRANQRAQLLIHEKLLLVGHRDLFKQHPFNHTNDLFNYTLLPHITRPELWPHLFAHLQVDGQKPMRFGMGFEHFYMTLEAVNRGAGLGLIPEFMVAEHLRCGQLTNPLDIHYNSDYGYYLVVPGYKKDLRKVTFFSDWIKQYLAHA